MNTIFSIQEPSSETAFLPYSGDREYLEEQLQWLDAAIALRLELLDAEQGQAAELAARHGMAMANIGRHIQSRLQASAETGVLPSLPYLSQVFELTELEEMAVVACLAIELERKYETVYELLSGSGDKLPTPDLIADLISRSEDERLEVIYALRADGLLRKQFMSQDLPSKAGPAIRRPLLLDSRIVLFVQGARGLPDAMRDYARLVPIDREPAPLLGNAEVQAKLRRWLTHRSGDEAQTGRSMIMSLWGRSGEGKVSQAEHVGYYFREPLFIVDMEQLAGGGGAGSLRVSLKKIYREVAMQGAILVLNRFREAFGDEEAASPMWDVLDDMAGLSCVAILLSERACQPEDRRRRIDLELELRSLQDEELAGAWETLSRSYRIDASVHWLALAARFQFTPGQIAHALRTARHLEESEWDGEGEPTIGWKRLIEACYRQVNRHLDAKATRLSPKNGWDDLVLPLPQKEKLQHACNHIRHKHIVYGSWGFGRKLSYGTGISMLFSGPPGTGKTMAAEIVGRELDMEIYRVDLSQIISKYIGETEKNLREIFDEAQASYAVLFFDEADALFGKRSEVKDSHDKNANTEVAFLLQKMEEYRGISIMATNFLQNIDEAFLRRINYIIRFPFPDEKQREEIWRRIYPASTPLHEDIDFPFLASKLEVAGGSIKNMALTSAFMASGSEESVGMKHILKAYQYELDKTNRALNRSELGEYGRLL